MNEPKEKHTLRLREQRNRNKYLELIQEIDRLQNENKDLKNKMAEIIMLTF